MALRQERGQTPVCPDQYELTASLTFGNANGDHIGHSRALWPLRCLQDGIHPETIRHTRLNISINSGGDGLSTLTDDVSEVRALGSGTALDDIGDFSLSVIRSTQLHAARRHFKDMQAAEGVSRRRAGFGAFLIRPRRH